MNYLSIVLCTYLLIILYLYTLSLWELLPQFHCTVMYNNNKELHFDCWIYVCLSQESKMGYAMLM